MTDSTPSVAVVGAGPGGLVTARWLRASGCTPTIFEQHDDVGGQWHVGAPGSGVWPGMRTNTSHVMTAFSDLPYPADTPTYPTAEAVGAYLRQYAAHVGVLGDVHLGTCVLAIELVDLDPGTDTRARWRVQVRGPTGAAYTRHFSHVVAAPGRYRTPAWPRVAGLAEFAGRGGVAHVAGYRGAAPYRGQRVLVLGHSISALEVASELALQGAARVAVAARRHRYVLQKLLAGVPIEYRAYTRARALAAEAFPPAATAAALREFIVRTSGHPAQFGAPCAAEDPTEAGFTQSQFYLALVAEGRVIPRPWPARVEGDAVCFADGPTESFDAIVCATGYALDLPFLGPTVRAALGPDADGASLYRHTFHPGLPGFALVGVYDQSGPYFPTLELQARWVAYTWGGRVAPPAGAAMVAEMAAESAVESTAEMAADVAARGGTRPRRRVPLRMHTWARTLALAAGVEPDPARWPALARALLFGPQSPASFRLEGPDALPDVAARVAADAAAFGAIPDSAFTDEERGQLDALAAARGDAAFTAFVATAMAPAPA